MLTAKKKKIKPTGLKKPHTYNGVDLSVLPRFIAYRAAGLRETLNLKLLLLVVVSASLASNIFFLMRADSFAKAYRLKEFMLVPGQIVGHTPAKPQTVPLTYADSAFRYFIGLVGNITPTDVGRKYERFSKYLVPSHAPAFMAKKAEWITTVETQLIYEQIEVLGNPEIIQKGSSSFIIKSDVRRKRWAAGENLGHINEMIEMELKVVPPDEDRNWIFQITNYKRRAIR